MSEPNKIIFCLYNHGSKAPYANYCPECLSIACGEMEKRLAEARLLIEKLGTVAHDDMAVLTAAEKWLEGKP